MSNVRSIRDAKTTSRQASEWLVADRRLPVAGHGATIAAQKSGFETYRRAGSDEAWR